MLKIARFSISKIGNQPFLKHQVHILEFMVPYRTFHRHIHKFSQESNLVLILELILREHMQKFPVFTLLLAVL